MTTAWCRIWSIAAPSPRRTPRTTPRANVITRAVGAEADLLDLEKRTGGLLPGDRLLLCSDGICKVLPDSQIAELLAMDEDAAAERLVMAALNADARDNVTAVTIEVMAAERP